MEYQAPGLIDDTQGVDQEQGRTEILAEAFAEAAGGYFGRLREYEDAIEDDEERIDMMQGLGGGGALLGVILFFLGIFVEPLLILLALVALVASIGYAYKQITEAQERIEENERNIEQNSPDGEVTFVSQIGVPLHLIPYQDRHIIFDSMGMVNPIKLDLASIDGDQLAQQRAVLDATHDAFLDEFEGVSVVEPEHVEGLVSDDATIPVIERPLIEKVENMTVTASEMERESMDVAVYTNDEKAASVKTFAEKDLLASGSNIPHVPVERSLGQCEGIVSDIRGMEEVATAGDLLDQAKGHRSAVQNVMMTHLERLTTNGERVQEHYQAYGEELEKAVRKHVCRDCLESEIRNIDQELNLVDEVLGEEGGSLGRVLGDEDLNRGTDEHFTEKIRTDIQDRIPELSDRLKDAYNTFEDLSHAESVCETHGDTETVPIENSGALFGEVWRSLYYEFREPIMESVRDLEKDAEEVRQNKEQKMIDVTQYEQIVANLEQELNAIDAEYEKAEIIEQKLQG